MLLARWRWRTQLATRPCSSARASEIEGIIGAQPHARWLVRAVAPLPARGLVRLGDRRPRLLAARAPLLPPRPALLRLGEGGLRLWVVPWMLHRLPLWREANDLEPHRDSRLLASRGEWRGEHRRAG